MKIIETDKVLPQKLNAAEREWVYNGLDACVTAEVLEVLLEDLDDVTERAYSFSRSLQGPVLDMRLRGILVDRGRRAEIIEELFTQLDRLETSLNKIVNEGCDVWEFKWSSPKDVKYLLHDVLLIPEERRGGRVTTDRNALEKLLAYIPAVPIVIHLLAMRDLQKKISTLKTAIDKDGRMRTSYNIAGTTSWRFSSSWSEFGTGGNMQNVEDILRQIFIADKGKKLAYFDAQQIQSRIVGAIEWNVFKDGRYLDACESGDLHTTVARMCEPKLPWNGDAHHDKDLAERPYYRQHSLRKLCKSIGHGTNFGGGPDTLSRMYKIPINVIADFQSKYHPQFGHLDWHRWVHSQLRKVGYIDSITGNRRYFWGRKENPDTIREAVAFDPQCSEAHIVNSGMLKVWLANICELLLQNHDAIVVQYPEEREDEIIPKVLDLLPHPVRLKHYRELLVPYGCETGWNWGKWSKDNPDGLKEYKGGDKRKRTPTKSVLDRPLR